jgi:chorismate synthase
MIRYLTAGESHGPQLTGIVEGVPAGLGLTAAAINRQLLRRQQGYGRGGRMAIEKDEVAILSGVRFGETMGGPIALSMPNRAYETDESQWPKVMHPELRDPGVEAITLPRPGHADLTGAIKYGFDDIRPVIERSSARETAMRVACCSVARAMLGELGIQVGGHVIRIGEYGYESWESVRERSGDLIEAGGDALGEAADASEVKCLDPDLTEAMRRHIMETRKAGSSLGGVYEIVVTGCPPGLGSYVHWDRKLDGQLAQAILSIQAMKGVEFGLGFESGRRRGHDVHDEIVHRDGRFRRATNRSGGLEGGMTTGEPVILRGVMKPIPTLLKPLKTADMLSGESTDTRYERSDVCAVPRAVVVAESVVALVIANAVLEKFGGDSMNELRGRFTAGKG